MQNRYVTPELLDVGAALLRWAKDFLAKEHPEMRRPVGSQVVCPFVQAALDSNSFYMIFHPEVRSADEAHIEGLVLGHIPGFERLGPFGPGDRVKKALLAVFPNLPEEEAYVLDVVHRIVKPTFLKSGLMIGQFHKNCREGSVHNRAFLASISPYPLLAVRHMAIHDILFLKDDRTWFAEYNLRFGERFRRPEDLEDFNRHLLGSYLAAKERWGT
jgi:heptaprenyl diphosphate synthase